MDKNNGKELQKKMRKIGKQLVLQKLQKYDWNIKKTAKDLKISKEEFLKITGRYWIKA